MDSIKQMQRELNEYIAMLEQQHSNAVSIAKFINDKFSVHVHCHNDNSSCCLSCPYRYDCGYCDCDVSDVSDVSVSDVSVIRVCM